MNTFDLINVAFTALEKRRDAKPSPEIGTCDVCGERPGDLVIKGQSVCNECDHDHYGPIARLPRFRTNDERDAWMAGSKTRGEI